MVSVIHIVKLDTYASSECSFKYFLACRHVICYYKKTKGGICMNKMFYILLCCMLLCGCTTSNQDGETISTVQTEHNFSTPSNNSMTSEFTTITVYVPNEDLDGFDTVDITGDKLSVPEAMVQAGVLPENIVINSFSWSEDTLTVDFGSEFRNLINNQGTTGEYMIIGSIVNTLITLNEVKYVRITVDGDILESGHVIYDFPMEFYE